MGSFTHLLFSVYISVKESHQIPKPTMYMSVSILPVSGFQLYLFGSSSHV